METLKTNTKEATNMNNDNTTTRDLFKQAWIQSGVYRTESLTAYINRVMAVNS